MTALNTATRRRIASRMDNIKTSSIYVLMARVIDLKAQGVDVQSLTAGEPDVDTPPHIVEAAHRAMLAGDTHYTPVRGSHAVREAIRAKYARESGLDFADEQVMVATGSKQIVFNALAVTLEPGDEVLLPAPYWAAYPTMIYAAGGVPKIVTARRENGYKLTADELRQSIGPRTRWVILNTPSNPTGAVYSEDELRDLGNVLIDYPDVWILSDEVYDRLHYLAKQPVSLATVCPQLANRLLISNGMSKGYAMTGWRIGTAAGPADLIAAMADLQAQTTLSPSSISQAAAVAALNGPTEALDHMVDVYRRRRDLVMSFAARNADLQISRPDGAFFALIDVSKVIADPARFAGDDVAFASWLLDEHRVAVVPGVDFGAKGTVRISFATDEATIERGLDALYRAVKTLG
ncbi:aspartate/methionine/tyrosine aminotransferase [Paraburkholderia unamae]|uniref:pyridoxal phosphate-dependent aminotransferase n=1 Tax=Paraburkholderia unamae TaxID=219649 RepID=UPI000DC26A01|nr:pyridoxal phosphate-dependent aminotransferase [Paraburkholderia unamae]RAR59286.1 aspartate/methionine/tyrosine aminotransferase [Paraburkholderia unamae]